MMKTVLENQDIELIAQRVVEIIRPFLPKEKTDDVIFSVEELAAYLRVSPKWVYDHKHELPHFKPGGLLRFRKKDIDKGIDMLFLNVQGKRNPKKEG
jgi:excisionase family DNA binding protein